MSNNRLRSIFKILLAFSCIAVAVIILVTSITVAFGIFKYNTGAVTNISTRLKNSGELELSITYFLPSGGYSVRDVPENEGEFIGDGMIDYNGDLGKYRIMIEFGDVEPHDALAKRMSRDGIFELNSLTVQLKAKLAHPSDHGFVLYIGSDTPIHVENMTVGKLEPICGTVRIPICVDLLEDHRKGE